MANEDMREYLQETWTNGCAEMGARYGLVSGVLAFYNGNAEVVVRSFIRDVDHEVKDQILAAIIQAAKDARKELASPRN